MALRGSVFLLIVLCVIVQPAVVHSQRYELTPFVGYRWGGEFKGGNYYVGDELTVSDLAVYFPLHTGVLSRVTGHVHAVDGVSFEIPSTSR